VLAQVPDLNDFVAGMRILLAPQGVLTIEFPHLVRLIEGNQFDTIYHEHFSYFSLLAVERVFAAHGLTVFDVEEIPTHGGSLRVYVRHTENGELAVQPAVAELREREIAAGFASLDRYSRFGEQVAETKRKLLEFLIHAKRAGQRIAAYGAPGKGNTLLNYCGIRTDFIDYAVDRNPYKHGKFLPGSRIPVFAPERIAETRPDYILILPWNLRAARPGAGPARAPRGALRRAAGRVDVPRLRSSTSGGYLTTGIAYAFHPHRDTWYSAPACQLNWWLPVFALAEDNGLAFHPRYWSEPLANGSRGYDYAEWNRTSRFTAASQIGVDTRPQPKPEQPLDARGEVRPLCPVGGLVLFSGAQLHASVPNTSGRTRYSIDFRTVHRVDAEHGVGAPNVDSACRGTSLGDFLRASDLARLPEPLVAAYERGFGREARDGAPVGAVQGSAP
jgi:hypothetical protein